MSEQANEAHLTELSGHIDQLQKEMGALRDKNDILAEPLRPIMERVAHIKNVMHILLHNDAEAPTQQQLMFGIDANGIPEKLSPFQQKLEATLKEPRRKGKTPLSPDRQELAALENIFKGTLKNSQYFEHEMPRIELVILLQLIARKGHPVHLREIAAATKYSPNSLRQRITAIDLRYSRWCIDGDSQQEMYVLTEDDDENEKDMPYEDTPENKGLSNRLNAYFQEQGYAETPAPFFLIEPRMWNRLLALYKICLTKESFTTEEFGYAPYGVLEHVFAQCFPEFSIEFKSNDEEGWYEIRKN